MAPPSRSNPLFDPREGTPAIQIRAGESASQAFTPSRTNYFGIYFIESGSGEFSADSASHELRAGSLLFFTPYQYIRILPATPLKLTAIQFHANFLCVEAFHAESGCAGTLFNDSYQPPIVTLPKSALRNVNALVGRMQSEQAAQELAFEDMLLAQLKMLLILATRLKSATAAACDTGAGKQRHPVLAELKQLIEANFQTLHSPSEYASRLHMSAKTLGRVVREQLGKSLTDLIRDRILIHAKWQMLHTLKPVKEVAREVGFTDELYFSRMFKKATGYSPTFFREFETEIRGGSNLSMLSPPAPILANRQSADTSGN